MTTPGPAVPAAPAAPATPPPTPARVVLLHAGEEVPTWARAFGAAAVSLPTRVDAPAEIEPGSPLAGLLAGAECVLLDADTLDAMSVARRVHRTEPEAQVVVVVGAEGHRRALERALVFTPGVGELWLASPVDVAGGIAERAAGVTRQRRRFRRTRERIERERVDASPQRSERALISDAYLANLLQVLPDPVFSVDAAGRILSANPAAARVLRPDERDLAGATLSEVLGVDDAVVAEALASAADRPSRAAVAFRRADGSAGHGELLISRIAGSEPAPFAVVLHDLTERHRAQRQLEEQALELELANQQLQDAAAELEAHVDQLQARSEEAEAARRATEQERERLGRVVAQAPVALAVYEGPDLRVRAMSAAYERIIGGRPALGLPIREALPELEGQGFFELMERVYTGGQPLGGSNVPASWDADGDGVPEARTVDFMYAPLVDGDGRAEGVAAFVLDVSDRTRLEEAERAARIEAEATRARLTQVFEQAPVGVAVSRVASPDRAAAEMVFDLANAHYVELVPRGRAVLGRSVREVFPELDPAVFVVLQRVLDTGEPFHATEFRVPLDRDGDGVPEEYWFNLVYHPLAHADGTVEGLVTVSTEVTAHVRARQEAERARAEAEEANRAKSQFLATMSHELRTPLNAIQGHLQLVELELHGPVTPAQREALGRIDRAQRHLLGLINDVLSYARLEGGRVEYDLQPTLAADVVGDVVPLVEPLLVAKGLTFESRLPEQTGAQPILVWADRAKLAQVLLNLLSNAVKFTPAGGRLTLELTDRPDAGEHQERAGDVPDAAFLRVRDTGVGIPRDKLESVFQPFVQVRGPYSPGQGGAGLGLAISRDLARGMGGDLRASSVEGAGSTFTVTLRRVIAPSGETIDRRTGEERRVEEERRRGEARAQGPPAPP